jgi:hypothetical protein
MLTFPYRHLMKIVKQESLRAVLWRSNLMDYPEIASAAKYAASQRQVSCNNTL